jgi:hypothetical protein
VILSVSPEFSGFSVHIHTYLVQPKTGADRGIKLVRPGHAAGICGAAASFHPKTHTPLMRPNVLRMALDADSPSLGCRLATSWPSMIELLGYSGQFE